jgi:predicted HTH transcriptional regulator
MGKKQKNYKALSKSTRSLIAGEESKTVDFKIKASGVKTDDFVAFSNGSGGTILIGVDEISDPKKGQRGRVVGCKIDDQTRQGLIGMAASCRPSIEIGIRLENIGTEQPIIRIDIPEGSKKPYCTSSGVYKIRGEGQNIAIDPNMMRAIILESEAEQFVARFKEAGDELLAQIQKVHADLAERITEVEYAAELATDAAQQAADAAEEAAWGE